MDNNDLEQWAAHPVTEAMFKALAGLHKVNKRKWLSQAWASGEADHQFHSQLQGFEQAIDTLKEFSIEDIETINEALNEE